MSGPDDKFSLDWRVAFGLGITLTWISTGLIYLLGIVGWDRFVHLPTADIGSFLEGAFAPLAFLWLVIGHFMQQKEITANTKAITLQEESARRLELHSQRDSYFKLLTLVQDQLGSIASFHYISVCGPTGDNSVSNEEFAEERASASTGDYSLFIRKMIALAVGHREDHQKLREIFYGTEVRCRHSDNFTHTFSKLHEAAKAVDSNDMLGDALLNGSAAGILYRIIQQVRDDDDLGRLMGFAPTKDSEQKS